ncbi:MAG: DUF934 domain-containing protein [Cellvibrio sp.]|uniref:DUF934 domain-containing protein n=1 Tax=Cellvibrio sp. TaxID=1965322 RepID=UPI0031B380BC
MKSVISVADGDAKIVTNDRWQLINDEAEETAVDKDSVILPLSLWQQRQSVEVLAGRESSADGIYLSPDDDETLLYPWLSVLPLIAIQFPSFRDGRGYTQAYMLRVRMGWAGELRAVGDVLRDQLSHMRQCGFDSFAVREDKSVEDALKGLRGLSVTYGRSVIEPKPLFRRRNL